ncbi:hypothetical protein ACFWB2_14760 [Streptomyces virginiae]|uniref:DUF7848 domain-containing protein n=1 Tax=Streptomyces virginiae TaxID=1961 RepID=UPI0036B964C2
MAAHTVIRWADWTMSPDRSPEAPPIVHEFQCTTCQEEGPASEDFETARTWTFQHVGRNPSHQGYREIIHRFWRMNLVG